MEKLKVEIWSDVMCPFCYIGKRKFEAALGQFAHKDHVEVTWKSYQLNPHVRTDPQKNIHQYLAEVKGWTLQRAQEMNDYVTDMARGVGLEYRMDDAIIANSFDAHRLSHMAKAEGLQNEAEEKIFAAYFTDGKNTADSNVLADIGQSIGLDKEKVLEMLGSSDYSKEVEQDIREAMEIGIRGVPFFVLDRKYAISGAQESNAFLQALNQAWQEYSKTHPAIAGEAHMCTTDGCN